VPVPTNDQIAEVEKYLVQIKTENWRQEDLFSPAWWIMAATLAIPWIIWWRYVDRSRMLQITLLGMLTLIVAAYLDTIGCELALWQYNKMLVPFWSRLICVDFSIMPVTYMFIFQYFRRWLTFTLISLLVALVFAFLVEPLLVWVGIYQLNAWSHWYSFAIYFIQAVFIRALVEKIGARGYSIR